MFCRTNGHVKMVQASDDPDRNDVTLSDRKPNTLAPISLCTTRSLYSISQTAAINSEIPNSLHRKSPLPPQRLAINPIQAEQGHLHHTITGTTKRDKSQSKEPHTIKIMATTTSQTTDTTSVSYTHLTLPTKRIV